MIIETANSELMKQLRAAGYLVFRIDSGNLLFIPATDKFDLGPICLAFKQIWSKDKEIEFLLGQKISWVLKKQREILHGEKKLEISKPVYTEGSTLPYLGKNYKIQVKILESQKENSKQVEKNSLVHKNELFLFNINPGIEENRDFKNEVRNLYENWLYHKAKIIFKDKVHLFSKEIGIKPNKVVIKNLKNRWASITKNNEINLIV